MNYTPHYNFLIFGVAALLIYGFRRWGFKRFGYVVVMLPITVAVTIAFVRTVIELATRHS
jgi:hypothetical protein